MHERRAAASAMYQVALSNLWDLVVSPHQGHGSRAVLAMWLFTCVTWGRDLVATANARTNEGTH